MKGKYTKKQANKGGRRKWFVRGCLAFGALYLLVMIGVTVYAQTIYVQRLPSVRLENPRSAEISYTLKEKAFVTEAGAVIELDLSARMFPVRILRSGCPASLTVNGNMLSGRLAQTEEQPDYQYLLTLDIDTGGLPPGTEAEAEIICEPVLFQHTIDRSLIYENMDGADVIYLVVQRDGPWGKQYVLEEREASFWPAGDSETVGLMLIEELRHPIARPVDPDTFLYAGMEVQLAA